MAEDKVTEFAKSAWRSQPIDTQVPSIEYLRMRARDHQRQISERNTFEYLLGAAAIAMCAWFAVSGGNSLLRWGCIVAAAGIAYSLLSWHRLRLSWSAALDGAPVDGRRFYKQELARLRDAHLRMWRSLPALLPGVGLLLWWGFTERTGSGNTTRVILLLVAVIAWIVTMLRHDLLEARRYAAELEALEREEGPPS